MSVLDALRTQSSLEADDNDLNEIETELKKLEGITAELSETADNLSSESDKSNSKQTDESNTQQLIHPDEPFVEGQIDAKSLVELDEDVDEETEEDVNERDSVAEQDREQVDELLSQSNNSPIVSPGNVRKVFVTGTRRFAPTLERDSSIEKERQTVQVREQPVNLDPRLLTTSYKTSLISAFLDQNPTVYPNSQRNALTVDLGEKGKVYDAYDSFSAEDMDDQTAAMCVVKMVQLKGWDSIHISGDDKYIEAITTACHKIGVEVIPEGPSLEMAMKNRQQKQNEMTSEMQEQAQLEADRKKQTETNSETENALTPAPNSGF